MTNFCPNCGSPVTSDSSFCANCGHSLAIPPAYLAPEPVQKQPSLRPVALVVASVALLVVGLVIVLVVLLNDDSAPEDAVREYVAAVESGDCDRLVELTYFDENSDQTEAELREDCAGPERFEVDYEILGSDEVDADLPEDVSKAAEVEVRITADVYGRTQSETSKVTVYRVDGDWLLYDEGGNETR